MVDTLKKASEPRSQEHQKRSRRPFVEPKIERQAKLPEVTNSFVGSFNP